MTARPPPLRVLASAPTSVESASRCSVVCQATLTGPRRQASTP
jgi:hypothetical protein